MRMDMTIEYMPETYPYYPYRVVWYTSPNDSLGTDLGGGKDIYDALVIMRNLYIYHDKYSASEVDAKLLTRYGEIYKKALRKYHIW